MQWYVFQSVILSSPASKLNEKKCRMVILVISPYFSAKPQQTENETTAGTSSSEGPGSDDLDYYVYDYDEYLYTTPTPQGIALKLYNT